MVATGPATDPDLEHPNLDVDILVAAGVPCRATGPKSAAADVPSPAMLRHRHPAGIVAAGAPETDAMGSGDVVPIAMHPWDPWKIEPEEG